MTRQRFHETTVADALKGSVGPLMRQIRKYAALKGLLAALPGELAEMAAPYDIKLAVRDDQATGSRGDAVHRPSGQSQIRAKRDAEPAADEERAKHGFAPTENAGAAAELNTMFIYVASPTVATVISQRRRALIEAANRSAGMPLVEELRCEQAPQAKITRQLNILGLKPD